MSEEAKTTKNTEICLQCRLLFCEDDDYDTAGSKSGRCCPQCGGEDMPAVEDVLLVMAQYWPKDWKQLKLF